MPVDCFTGADPLKYVYINDKHSILLKHWAQWESQFSPSNFLYCTLQSRDYQFMYSTVERIAESGCTKLNEDVLTAVQHKD